MSPFSWISRRWDRRIIGLTVAPVTALQFLLAMGLILGPLNDRVVRTPPALADGRLYVRHDKKIVTFDLLYEIAPPAK